jgi:Phosphotransferase enzyme family
VRLEGHAFVPARGGIVAVDGRLPSAAEPRPASRLVWTARGPLHVFEPVDAPGVPPGEVAVPEPLRASFEQCDAELRGAPAPDRRAAWSRPGWHAQAEAWAGMPLEQVRIWPLSAVLRNGDTWFKAVFPRFHHEPAITEALGAPRLLQVDHERGWMLMEAVPGIEEDDHHAAMRAIARVHREWAARVDEALALGAHDRRAPSALPHTLVHGDFHAGNVGGETIIDWSDAAVANPLHDVNHYLLFREPEQRDALLATYAEAWPEYDVTTEAAACEAETYEYIAQSYAGINDALAADDRWWFEDDPARWLRFASDVRAGRRPNPDT